MPPAKKSARKVQSGNDNITPRPRGRPKLNRYAESTFDDASTDSETGAETTPPRRAPKRKATPRSLPQPPPAQDSQLTAATNALLAMQTAMSAQMHDMREMKAELITQMQDLKNNPPKRRRLAPADPDMPDITHTAADRAATAVYAQDLPMPILDVIRPTPAPRTMAKTCCGTPHPPPAERTSCCGTPHAACAQNISACPAQNPTVITELITAASTNTTADKKKGKQPLLPHLFVIRGSRREKIAVGEATMPEYIAALCKMTKDADVPTNWKEPISEHIHNLAMMACEWEWNTCRIWSEKVFDMIDDGRLPHAWADHYAVKDIQRDAYAVGNRVSQNKYQRPAAIGNRQLPAPAASTTQTNNQSGTGASTNTDTRQEFNRDTDGKPCHPWNWGNDCGFSATHGEGADRKVHVCAWCANKYRRANVHKEKDCLNKKRYLDKKAAQTSDSASQQDGQGFC